MYEVPIGRAAIRRTGTDVTIVATSHMSAHALQAAATLESRGIDAEVIDLRSIKPWDRECVFSSVRNTGRLVIADAAWKTCGAAAEAAARVASEAFDDLKAPIPRVGVPCPPPPPIAQHEHAYHLCAHDL